MQTARHLVGTLVELTSGMQDRQHDLQSRFAFFLMNIYRNTTTIVSNRNGIILIDHHINIRTKSGQCFIYRVVNDFIYKMMQTLLTGITDVHGGSFANGL